jgi:hypothetical protein
VQEGLAPVHPDDLSCSAFQEFRSVVASPTSEIQDTNAAHITGKPQHGRPIRMCVVGAVGGLGRELLAHLAAVSGLGSHSIILAADVTASPPVAQASILTDSQQGGAGADVSSRSSIPESCGAGARPAKAASRSWGAKQVRSLPTPARNSARGLDPCQACMSRHP